MLRLFALPMKIGVGALMFSTALPIVVPKMEINSFQIGDIFKATRQLELSMEVSSEMRRCCNMVVH
jgi:hypothetical protein